MGTAQKKKNKKRGGGVGVRANRLSPFLPSRCSQLSERLAQANLLTVRCGLCFKVVHGRCFFTPSDTPGSSSTVLFVGFFF